MPDAARRPAARAADASFSVVAAGYTLGLVAWLVLGLLPPLASAIPAVRTALGTIGADGGPIGDVAVRVLVYRSSLPHGPDVAVQYLFSLLNLTLGFVLLLRAPRALVPRLLALGFLGTAATFNEPSHAVFHIIGHVPAVTAIHFCFHIVSGVTYVWAVALFPDGRLPLKRKPRAASVAGFVVVSTALLAWLCYHSSFVKHPPFFVEFFGATVPVVGIVSQTAHLRLGALGAAGRQQARLLRLALVPALGVAALWGVARAVGLAGGGMASGASQVTEHVQSAFPAVFALVPAVLFVAVLRYRLFEVDLVLSRALMFVMLGGGVALVFVAALGATGWLLRGQAAAAAVAMVVVGVGIEPARRWCGRQANRLVFGQQRTPRESMRLLAERLGAPADDDALAELVRVVVGGTRCTAAEIWLVAGDRLTLAAAAPPRPTAVEVAAPGGTEAACVAALPGRRVTPVRHEGVLLAVLAVELPKGTALPIREARLLDDLARSAGLLVANARLVGDLARQVAAVTALAADLRRSRQQVVAAQDAERRRLERDLHDGAQQELVSLLLQLRVLQRRPDPSRVPELRGALAAARETLRALSEGEQVAVLTELGLVAGLRARAATVSGVAVTVTGELLRLPAEVEAAVWYCCLEAMQNAAKHASADRLTAALALADGELTFTVTDDGVGFDPATAAAGRGLRNYLERLVVLGGDVVIESAPGSGTAVRGRVPVPVEALPAAAAPVPEPRLVAGGVAS